MNTSAGYQQYEKNKILTASPAELTLMLYDGAIKYANIAIMAIDKGDVEGSQQYPQGGTHYRRVSEYT